MQIKRLFDPKIIGLFAAAAFFYQAIKYHYSYWFTAPYSLAAGIAAAFTVISMVYLLRFFWWLFTCCCPCCFLFDKPDAVMKNNTG